MHSCTRSRKCFQHAVAMSGGDRVRCVRVYKYTCTCACGEGVCLCACLNATKVFVALVMSALEETRSGACVFGGIRAFVPVYVCACVRLLLRVCVSVCEETCVSQPWCLPSGSCCV